MLQNTTSASTNQPMATKRIKILSLGNVSTGKTTLIKRYCEGRFERRYYPTIGVDYGSKRVSLKEYTEQNGKVISTDENLVVDAGVHNCNKGTTTPSITAAGRTMEINVDFFDLSGHGEYFEIRNEFYQGVQGVFLVYDVNDEESFEALDKWLSEGKKFGLDVCRAGTPLVLCANKIDQQQQEEGGEEDNNNNCDGDNSKHIRQLVTCTQKRGIDYAEKHHMTFFQTSALDGRNVQSMFECLFRRAASRYVRDDEGNKGDDNDDGGEGGDEGERLRLAKNTSTSTSTLTEE